VTNSENFKVLEKLALPIIEGTDDTVFTVGACWHGMLNFLPPPHVYF
jgi:hypothetical protein